MPPQLTSVVTRAMLTAKTPQILRSDIIICALSLGLSGNAFTALSSAFNVPRDLRIRIDQWSHISERCCIVERTSGIADERTCDIV